MLNKYKALKVIHQGSNTAIKATAKLTTNTKTGYHPGVHHYYLPGGVVKMSKICVNFKCFVNLCLLNNRCITEASNAPKN